MNVADEFTVADALAYDRDDLKNLDHVARLIARIDDER
jgi:hypothetical protein